MLEFDGLDALASIEAVGFSGAFRGGRSSMSGRFPTIRHGQRFMNMRQTG